MHIVPESLKIKDLRLAEWIDTNLLLNEYNPVFWPAFDRWLDAMVAEKRTIQKWADLTKERIIADFRALKPEPGMTPLDRFSWHFLEWANLALVDRPLWSVSLRGYETLRRPLNLQALGMALAIFNGFYERDQEIYIVDPATNRFIILAVDYNGSLVARVQESDWSAITTVKIGDLS